MSEQSEDLRTLVRETYGAIVRNESSCCGPARECADAAASANMIGDAYKSVEGYVADADFGLGCGVPTEHADLKAGNVVLDLGAGAGIDAFVARRLVGETGQVYGVDMTPDMVAKARANGQKLGFSNVEFRLGEIERLPFERDSIDVVISNCVLNLVPDKARAFAEVYRVLRPGARFCISDTVASAPLPEALRKAAALYVSCVAGALPETDYLAIITEAGFRDVRVAKERRIDLPEAAVADSSVASELTAARAAGLHIKSITVVGSKPR